ncbi:MAG: hypothetical protein ABIG93_02405 [archaeon]
MCNRCRLLMGLVLLVLGILFLLRDLAIWDFWNVQWWTALILLMGLAHFRTHLCPECKKICKTK